MSRWQNFSIWRGRLPHWRADDVVYYITFRHRRPLAEWECAVLLAQIRKPDGRKWTISIACCLPEQTEIMLKLAVEDELSDIIEKAKTRAGKFIIKKTEERYPPFYNESYDRIVRDEAEFEERYMAIMSSPVDAEICEDPSEYVGIWIPDLPTD